MTRRSLPRFCLLGGLCLLAVLGPGASGAAAAAPTVGNVWISAPQPTVVRLHAEVNPNGKASSYHFDYIRKAVHDANLAAGKDAFAGTSRLPAVSDTAISGVVPTAVNPLLSGLASDTAYRYRFVVKNADGTTTSPARDFETFPAASPFALPDGRAWEMVSPVEKNGGQVDLPETLAGGGVLQAAADGQAVTYGSAASFAGGAEGATVASQYLSARATAGWATLNITSPLVSGSYGGDDGTPYRLFSPDLARALLLNGRPCRGDVGGCPVANPPLPGTDAPPGYQNYYLRESSEGGFEALLGTEVEQTDLGPAEFGVDLAGASPDLRHVVLSTCAALTPNAVEVPLGVGCDPAKPNLYLFSAGSLTLVNLLPAQSVGAPGATLGAQSSAISADGGRVYFGASGNLYLRAGGQTKQVDAAAGGGGTFQVAAADGSIAFFTKAGHLYRYDALAETATDLTPGGGVAGVLGAAADGSRVYFVDGGGLKLWHAGTVTGVAAAADASNYPPVTGTARTSEDGTKLLFASTVPLTTSDGHTYDNLRTATKTPVSQLYLYDAAAGDLTCVSCNPTHARPLGPSTVSGAIANGQGADATRHYKPRALSSDGRRVFFDSEDALVLADVNLGKDVYQWEAQGKGTCADPGGCISLISAGLANWASFVDASADGSDAFFLTDRSLVGMDPSSVDLYDAKIGGGLPEPAPPSPCVGDACQPVPVAPEDPVLTTVLQGPGNPAERYRSYGAVGKCPKGKKRRGGKCVRKAKAKRKGKGRKKGGRR